MEFMCTHFSECDCFAKFNLIKCLNFKIKSKQKEAITFGTKIARTAGITIDFRSDKLPSICPVNTK